MPPLSAKESMTVERFAPTFDSLSTYSCPDWFRDAKLGIWSHWGPQCVPMHGDWYARKMYIEGSDFYLYHLRHYGHPSKFGYKDICALWKAEAFDPQRLMGLYKRAGARYFVAQAMHHDNFFNYPSSLNRMNSMNVGPHKDICGLWRDAARAEGLPFGLSEHLGAAFSWGITNKGADRYGPFAGVPYDGNDPEWRDFYFDNYEHVLPENGPRAEWYTHNAAFRAYWLAAMREAIDLFEPDLLYTDGALPFGAVGEEAADSPEFAAGLEAVAYLYNKSIARNGRNLAVYTQKDRREQISRVGLLDVEKSQLPGISPRPWQTCTCIGNWFYDACQTYKRPDHIIEMLVDIVSKNGTVLLNILQRPDGSLDAETEYILSAMADWFDICAEGVYSTRPWKRFGEGETRVAISGFREDKTAWLPSDYRFTAKGNTVYAFMLGGAEGGAAVLRSFGEGERVRSVRLLGCGQRPFVHQYGVLTVSLPERLPAACANCLAIELDAPCEA